MGTDAYLAFIALGLIMIVADGQLLYHSGKRYLSDVDEGDAIYSMAKLVTVLFHLVMFGFLALLSVLTGSAVTRCRASVTSASCCCCSRSCTR